MLKQKIRSTSVLISIVFSIIFLMTACPTPVDGDGPDDDAQNTALRGIQLNAAVLKMPKGVQAQLEAHPDPIAADTPAMTWSSSNSAVASVSSDGKITAVSPGTATITGAAIDGAFSAACSVTVVNQLKRTFFTIDFRDNSGYDIPSTCLSWGEHCIVFAEDARLGEVSIATANAVRDEFDDKIFPTIRASLGDECDVDGNGRIIIVIQDILDDYAGSGSYVGGYFYPGNQYDVATAPESNEADMLCMDTNPASVGSQRFYRTLAHEYQHLVNFSNTEAENGTGQDIWINEGLSTAAEYLYMQSLTPSAPVLLQDWIAYYNDNYGHRILGNNFFIWEGNWEQAFPEDVLDNYCTAYLFFQWLRAHAVNGSEIYRDILSSPYRDHRAVTQAAARRIGAEFGDFGNLIQAWYLANWFQWGQNSFYGYGRAEVGINNELEKFFLGSASSGFTLAPGEGVIVSKSGPYLPPSDAGIHIRYAGMTMNDYRSVDVSAPHAGDFLLAINENSDQSPAAEELALRDECLPPAGLLSRDSPGGGRSPRVLPAPRPPLGDYPIDAPPGSARMRVGGIRRR